MTIGEIIKAITVNLGRTTTADLNPVNFTPPGPNIDLGLWAVNAARRKAERIRDFYYARTNVTLSIASSGTLLTAATPTTITKRVLGVELPITGDTVPVEFMTYDEWGDRIRRQVGRTPYSASVTPAQLGIGDINPICYQLGQKLYLVPASQFTFPVSATVNVVQFMPDYDADADTDFFTEFAPEYLQWAAIAELNKFWRRFIPRQEGNVEDAEVTAMANEALQTLLQWDSDLAKSTSSPEGTDNGMPTKR